MATKTVGLTLNINELTEDKTSTAWVSGKTVYGRTVTASTEVIQEAQVTSSLSISPTVATYPASARTDTSLVTWSSIPSGVVSLTLSGDASFSQTSSVTAKTLNGTSGIENITIFFNGLENQTVIKTYVLTATATGNSGSLSATHTVTHQGIARLVYVPGKLTIKSGNTGVSYWVNSVDLFIDDSINTNQYEWEVSHEVNTNGFVRNTPTSYGGISTTSMTSFYVTITDISISFSNVYGTQPKSALVTIRIPGTPSGIATINLEPSTTDPWTLTIPIQHTFGEAINVGEHETWPEEVTIEIHDT